MTRIPSNTDMATVRHSLAEAGIYFDKLYINQAYFNSNFNIQTASKQPKRSSTGFWHRLLCGTDVKRSSIGTQTVLTVRDDSELVPPPTTRRQRMPPTDNVYDRRHHRPLTREYTHNNYQQSIRRRRSSLLARATQMQRQKQMNDADEDENDEFAV